MDTAETMSHYPTAPRPATCTARTLAAHYGHVALRLRAIAHANQARDLDLHLIVQSHINDALAAGYLIWNLRRTDTVPDGQRAQAIDAVALGLRTLVTGTITEPTDPALRLAQEWIRMDAEPAMPHSTTTMEQVRAHYAHLYLHLADRLDDLSRAIDDTYHALHRRSLDVMTVAMLADGALRGTDSDSTARNARRNIAAGHPRDFRVLSRAWASTDPQGRALRAPGM